MSVEGKKWCYSCTMRTGEVWYEKDVNALAWIYPNWNCKLMMIKRRLLSSRSISFIPGSVFDAMEVSPCHPLSLESLLPLWKMSSNFWESESYTISNHTMAVLPHSFFHLRNHDNTWRNFNIDSVKQEKGNVHNKDSISRYMQILPVILDWQGWTVRNTTCTQSWGEGHLLGITHYPVNYCGCSTCG